MRKTSIKYLFVMKTGKSLGIRNKRLTRKQFEELAVESNLRICVRIHSNNQYNNVKTHIAI